ncbi:DNA polymerase III subunit beta [Roseospirillum parvum]|uniref:Beta sliding clamp n=1 Tax=Roseospirillum parvum TaxID=83401 RepID=A0A1G7ZVJ1_9PROT|nr:DNA polymerase III subunit beta [Roseospirillum parvum]SDH12637.1 DNA polymerase-3 subunit beta [Roseospirillum parvum]
MKLTIERTALLKSLGHVQSVVERRNTLAILSNVLLTAGPEGLSLNATDMDLEIVETAPAEVVGEGATTAPAHTLYDIVRKLPDGAQVELSFEPEDGQLTLRSGRSRFALAALPAGEFPAMSSGAYGHTFSLAAGELRSLIDRTRFAISTEETRYYLNGIFLHAADNGGVAVLRAVATDGHRLARVEMPLPEGAAGMPSVIVPRKAVAELRKLIDEADDDITVSLSESRIRFAFGSATLTSKLIDGTFPDYERVIPTDNDKLLEADCKLLHQAVDRVSAISSEKSRAIKVSLEKGSLTLSASSPEAGSAVEEIEAGYEGPPLEIGFNSRYLLDILQQVDGDAARFAIADNASPTVVQDVADQTAVYVLMPMRV